MEINEINNKKNWEDFLLACEEKTFLDSWNWGEFQKMLGDKIWRLGIFDNKKLIGAALVIRITARRGKFLFCPHAPVIMGQKIENKEKILEILIGELKKIARAEGSSFIRVSPICERNEKNSKIFKDLGFIEAPIHIHPDLTWELDVTLPEETLLAQTRKTTRYLIRQAQKNNDISIIKSTEVKDLERFNELYRATVDRHHFTPFSLNYLEHEFLAFSPDNQIVIFLGKYKHEILSSAIIIFWQGIAFYHQGASKYSKIPVSYLLQWEAIREAKNRDCKIYNFWGIAPNDSSKHPWAGLTLFKKGFGGYKKEYVKTQDFILSKNYLFNYFIEKIRKIQRRL